MNKAENTMLTLETVKDENDAMITIIFPNGKTARRRILSFYICKDLGPIVWADFEYKNKIYSTTVDAKLAPGEYKSLTYPWPSFVLAEYH